MGLLPGVRPTALDKLMPNQGEERTKRVQREVLTSLTAEEKMERRRERARAYSHMARRRTESSIRELMAEVERLTVFRLLVEEALDTILVLSPNLEAVLLFASSPSLGHLLGRPVLDLIYAADRPRVGAALAGLLRTPSSLGICIDCRMQRLDQGAGLGGEGAEGAVAVELGLRVGTQGIVCNVREQPRTGTKQLAAAAEQTHAMARQLPAGPSA